MTSLLAYIKKKFEKANIDYAESNNIISLLVQEGENAGTEYLVFILTQQYGELKKIYHEYIGNPVIMGIVENDNKVSIYIVIRKENRWIEFDIKTNEKKQNIKNFLKKSILSFIEKNHESITGVFDSVFQDFISKLIDREKRVKEGGLLIAAYINYLEGQVKNLKSIIKSGWNGLVLQLMVMYFLHKRGITEKIDVMKFEIFNTFEDYKKGKLTLKPEGYELWNIFRDDLKKFGEISKDSLFSLDDYDRLNKLEYKISNKIFLGKTEASYEFRYENIKKALKKLERYIFEDNDNFRQAQRELWDKFTELGILPLFEIRRWYESGLTGDIIGGVYEGIKKLEERKKGGIYYTPKFIVEYIVNNTLDPYIQEIIKEISNTEYISFIEFVKKSTVDDLEVFYDNLTSIKILDPACGTGHFLVYAMEKLTVYYTEIWKRIKNLTEGKFTIEILDKNGRRTVNLRNLRFAEIPFVIRQHLILKNNIYGVDIDEYAHQIAKARLLIEVFEHYTKEVKDAGYEFPNIEMNIKTGNSLVGFTAWDEIQDKITICDFFGQKHESKLDRIKHLMKKVKETGELNEYEKNMDEIRNLTNDVFLEYLTEKMRILPKKEFNDYRNKIKQSFIHLKPFHWIIEFPHVFDFKKSRGFDIVIGNPPYVDYRSINENERLIFRFIFESATVNEKYSLYVPFSERSIKLLKSGGIFCFIMPQKWLSADMGLKLRQLILRDYYLYEIVDLLHTESPVFVSQAFSNVGLYFIKKSKKTMPYNTRVKYHVKHVNELSKIQGKIVSINDITLFDKNIISPSLVIQMNKELIETLHLNNKSSFLSNFLTLEWGTSSSYSKKRKNQYFERSIPLIQTSDIQHFTISWQGYYIPEAFYTENRLKQFKNKKIVITRRSPVIRSVIDLYGFALGKVAFTTNVTEEHFKYITCLLNSKLLDYIFKIIFETQHPGGSFQYDKNYLNYLPIKDCDNYKRSVFNILHDIISFSGYVNKTYFSKLFDLVNCLIYEVYLKDKFYEDGLYPAPDVYLLKTIIKHLKPINFDSWVKLYWKKQIEGELLEREERKLEELEEKNTKIIDEVYFALQKDSEVQKWIEKIKSHEWVRRIEGTE